MSMTKRDLARETQLAIAKSGGYWTEQKRVTEIIETVFDLIVCHFQNDGREVAIRGFGTFNLTRRRAFTGKDPRNGRAIHVPERYSISFRPGKETKRRLNRE